MPPLNPSFKCSKCRRKLVACAHNDPLRRRARRVLAEIELEPMDCLRCPKCGQEYVVMDDMHAFNGVPVPKEEFGL